MEFTNKHCVYFTRKYTKCQCTGSLSFLVPVSSPVHFEGIKNHSVFSVQAISEQQLSGRGGRCEQHVCTASG